MKQRGEEVAEGGVKGPPQTYPIFCARGSISGASLELYRVRGPWVPAHHVRNGHNSRARTRKTTGSSGSPLSLTALASSCMSMAGPGDRFGRASVSYCIGLPHDPPRLSLALTRRYCRPNGCFQRMNGCSNLGVFQGLARVAPDPCSPPLKRRSFRLLEAPEQGFRGSHSGGHSG